VTTGTTFFLNVLELLAVLAVLAAVWLVYEHREGFAFAATTITIASCILSIFTDLYPNVMVSSTNPAYNLTVHNTASGAYSLKVMTVWSSSSCRSCSPTRPGPTTCSGGASAGRNSSRPPHPPEPSRNRNPGPPPPRPGQETEPDRPLRGDANQAPDAM
jgi:hypothetical protein